MRHVLFVLWNGGGNVNPVLALGRQLSDAGHGVRALGSPSLTTRFSGEGLAFTARDAATEWDAQRMAADVVAECERVATDAVVVDYMMPGALCGAERTGIPTAALVHTLYRAIGVDADGGPMAMASSVASVNKVREHLALQPIERLSDLLQRTDRILVTSPLELDGVPPSADHGRERYVGPVLEDAGSDRGWRAPGDESDGPLIVISLGTTPMDEAPVLQRVLDGVGEAHVRVVATLGAHIDPTSIRVPANATVTGYIRHAAVLPHASLVITHGGLGTVVASLAHGLPMVCIPLGREQPANANAVERVGAGRVVDNASSSTAIARAALDVLESRTYRDAASRLASTIEELQASNAARMEVEQLALTKR
ncbi:MAG TPA: glycosyltransferase [Acidimicrobiales bacterium]|nr:glycosyltransferase [Acidimicrobiales bacterium]